MKEKQFENESSLIVLGFKIFGVYVGFGFKESFGTPTSVEFDVDFGIKYRKWLLGFYHVHPNMLNYPSSIDHQTMYTWCNVVGRPLFCMIEGLDGEYYDDPLNEDSVTPIMVSNYLFKTYPREFKDNEMVYIGHVKRFGKFFIWRKEL